MNQRETVQDFLTSTKISLLSSSKAKHREAVTARSNHYQARNEPYDSNNFINRHFINSKDNHKKNEAYSPSNKTYQHSDQPRNYNYLRIDGGSPESISKKGSQAVTNPSNTLNSPKAKKFRNYQETEMQEIQQKQAVETLLVGRPREISVNNPIAEEEQVVPQRRRTHYAMGLQSKEPKVVTPHVNLDGPKKFTLPKTPENKTKNLHQLLNILQSLKYSIDDQIFQLQHLLDYTSKYLQDIDKEFQKIKGNVMQFVSDTMDAAFVTYKAEMIDWSKYEAIEKKAVQTKVQLANFLETQKKTANQSFSQNQLKDKQTTIAKETEHYRHVWNQLKEVRAQCNNMRPLLRLGNIQQFQNALLKMLRLGPEA